ncbi:MAG TPA: DNA polymerase III subunit gamma/tau, partial [Vicinamibacterales bacterium]|nr:DNA polymerase III subunit gamma/tau [Vicinamibacterales bacterium]
SMSHVALARKWRPQRFEDVIGQRGVVDTLRNAIASGRLAQSFIFAGPRGVGKTTTARILARALNCVNGPTGEPCGVCDACREIAEGRDVDVLEIDGATYTGVDAVREVIVEPLSIAPMRDRFKIFIIDEVHRLSKHAFDALLKSIEEPPPYVKFMMATTELHLVPVTIQSRSQVYELKALSAPAIREQLRGVTEREGVTIDDAALGLVARAAEGSMRDALSALDQVLAFTSEAVTAADVSTVLGLIGRDMQFDIVETVAREDLAGAFALAGTVVEAGFDLRIVCRELARLMRDLFVLRIDPTRVNDPDVAAESERERITALAKQYSREDLMRAFDLLSRAEYEIRNSSQPRHHFEMTLVKWIHLRQLTPLADLIAGLESGRPGAAPLAPGKPAAQPPARPAPRSADASSKPAAAPAAASKSSAPAPPAPAPSRAAAPSAPATPVADVKGAVLGSIREQEKLFYNMCVAQARSIDVEGDAIVFSFLPVHKVLKAQFEAKRAKIEQLAQAAAGRRIAIVVREAAPVETAAAGPDPAVARRAELEVRAKAEPAVQAVLDVFGGEIEDVEEIG